MPDTRLEKGLIVYTSSSCKFKGQSWPDIPTLLWPDGIDETASDWFRTLVVDYGVATSSVKEYAKTIRPFFRFCRERKRAWQTVDDEFLIVWREYQRRGLKISIPRVNTSLQTIFSFYRWAEETKRIRYQVGIYTPEDLSKHTDGFVFPISAKQKFSKGRHGRVYGNWTTPLTLSNPRQGVSNRHTPTEKEIRDIHATAMEKEHGVRDSLIFSWAEEAGPRRAEIMRLCKSHMPTSDQLANCVEQDKPWLISVKRKGDVSSPLNALPDLIIQTLDYISIERRAVVESCQQSIVGYREPNEIFLSGTTGLPLHLDSVTSIGRRAFHKVGVEKANIHRLRARYAVRVVETLVDAIFEGETVVPESSWIETILVRAAEMMGHRSPQSLRPYLTYVLNRRIQTADATKAEKLASRIRQLERRELMILNRLSEHSEIICAVQHVQAGRTSDAVSVLEDFISRLE